MSGAGVSWADESFAEKIFLQKITKETKIRFSSGRKKLHYLRFLLLKSVSAPKSKELGSCLASSRLLF